MQLRINHLVRIVSASRLSNFSRWPLKGQQLISVSQVTLKIYSEIDITFSGTTTVLLLIANETLYCANIGDSRAILCSETSEGWRAQPLSIDHKGD